MSKIYKLWGILPESQKHKFVGLLIMIIVATVLEMIGIGLIIPLLALMTSMDTLKDMKYFSSLYESIGSPPKEQLLYITLTTLLIVYVIKTIFLIILAWVQGGFYLLTQSLIAEGLLKSYIKLPWLTFKSRNSSNYMQTANKEVEILIQSGYVPLFEVITSGFLFTASGLLLLLIEPFGTLSMMAILGVAFLGFLYLSKVRASYWGKLRQSAEYKKIQWLKQSISSIKEIKVYQKQQFFCSQFKKQNLQLIYVGRWQATLRKLPKITFELLAIIGLVTAIITMINTGRSIEQITPIIGLFAAIFIKLLPSINSILAGIHSIRYIEPTIDLIHKELQTELTHYESSNGTGRNSNSYDINVENINFSYPEASHVALKDISLQIPYGQFIGIVGKSGAGKSTLIDLLLGLITPNSGTITCDGKNIKDNISMWHNAIGYVSQSVTLLDSSIKQNVAFGLPDDEIKEEKVVESLKNAQLMPLIETLPDGINTNVGDNGSALSGGERQRLGLARALYRDVPILFLDEATASLDSKTEKDIMGVINTLKGVKTIIMVTHNHINTKNCDQVICIQDGVINHNTGHLE